MPRFVSHFQHQSPDIQTMLDLEIPRKAMVIQRWDLYCIVLVDVL